MLGRTHALLKVAFACSMLAALYGCNGTPTDVASTDTSTAPSPAPAPADTPPPTSTTPTTPAAPTPSYSVSPTGSHVTLSPSSSQTVTSGGTTNFTVTPATGYSLSTSVGGTCPAGQWNGSTYSTGAVSADCSVSFSATLNTYSVGVTITGLSGTVVLQDNGGDDLTESANGSYTFATHVAYGSAYSVSVRTQPSNQTCSVSSGSGTMGAANVSGIAVNCSSTPVTVTPSGSNLSFSPASAQVISSGSTQAFTVTAATGYTLSSSVGGTCPAGQWSGATYTTGAVSSDCTVSFSAAVSTYTVGVTIKGLAGTVVLQDNGGDNLSKSANGSYSFATSVAYGAAYSVTVLTQPTGQKCTVTQGSGTMGAANVTGIAVNCLGWKQQGIAPTHLWQSVTAGSGGKYVAISQEGASAASSDGGATWALGTLPGPSYLGWWGVAYGTPGGTGTYVAVASNGTAATSTDGVNWTQQTTLGPNDGLTSIAWGNGQFVATGDYGNWAATSPDGVTWTKQTINVNLTTDQWKSIVYGGGVFAALGCTQYVCHTATSADGVTWSSANAPYSNLNSIAYGNGVFVVVGGLSNSSQGASSTDGITWTNRTLPAGTYNGVTYGNGVFVAVGNNGVTTTSADGVTWAAGGTLPSTTLLWQTVVYGGSSFLAMPQQTNANQAIGANIAATSSNGSSWSQQSVGPARLWQSVTTGGAKYVAISQDGASAASSDGGVTWALGTLPGPSYLGWWGVAYGTPGGTGRYVAVASNGTAATSTDGVNWTQQTTLGPNDGLTSIAWGNGQFVATGDYGNWAATSPDGVTWTKQTINVNLTTDQWKSIVYGGGVFAALGCTQYVCHTATSADGVTWTTGNAPYSSLNSIAYGNGIFVLVGGLSNSSQGASSTDGITWTNRTLPAGTYNGVTYGNGMFVAIGNNGVTTTSADGVTWTAGLSLPSTTDFWQAIVYGSSGFVAVPQQTNASQAIGVNMAAVSTAF